MNNPQQIADLIRLHTTLQKISIRKMLKDIGLGVNSLSHMDNGSMPKADNLGKVADYLKVSVDYLLGRTENTTTYQNIQSSNVVNGNNGSYSPLTVNETEHYDEMTSELVKAFKSLQFADKMDVLNFVMEKGKK